MSRRQIRQQARRVTREVRSQVQQVRGQVRDDLAHKRQQVSADLRRLADETSDRAGNLVQRFLHRPWTNAWRIFARDVKAVCTNTIGLIVAVGLVVIPAFYSWFNIAGAWNVYDNTGGLKVAVANQDSGYQSDLLPMKVNVGNQLTTALRSNKQLGWTFVSRSEAVEGVHSGRYYAAIVIPKNFSADMLTFFAPKMTRAKIVYYENEKENPLAPKVTDQGADTIRSQINGTFSSTLTSVALDLATTLGRFLGSPRTRQAMGSFVSHVGELAHSTRSTAGLVGSYAAIVSSAADVVSSAGSDLPSATSLTSQARRATVTARSNARKAGRSLETVADSLTSAAVQSKEAAQGISAQADAIFDDVHSSASTTATSLESLARQARDLAQHNRTLKRSVDKASSRMNGLLADFDRLHPILPPTSTRTGNMAGDVLETIHSSLVTARDTLDALSTRLTRAIGMLTDAGNDLDAAAQTVRTRTAGASATHKQVKSALSSALSQLQSLANESSTHLAASLRALDTGLSPLVDDAAGLAADADATISDLSTTTGTASRNLAQAGKNLRSTQRRLARAAQALIDFSGQLTKALTSRNAEQLEAVTRSSADRLAGLIAAPISIQRHAVYPVATFGMQMTPFYGILATWVGSTLLAAAVTPMVSENRRRGLRHLRAHQLYFGRQFSFTFIALLQATLLGLGCLFFLGVQAVHPFLFMVTLWATALVFSVIMFSLSYTLGAIGKAICVILLVVQISGSNGMYPVVLMPHFFNAVMPFLPATHSMNALRACIGGFYGSEWTADMGKLLIFLVPMLIMSLLLKKPLSLLSDAFSRATRASRLLP